MTPQRQHARPVRPARGDSAAEACPAPAPSPVTQSPLRRRPITVLNEVKALDPVYLDTRLEVTDPGGPGLTLKFDDTKFERRLTIELVTVVMVLRGRSLRHFTNESDEQICLRGLLHRNLKGPGRSQNVGATGSICGWRNAMSTTPFCRRKRVGPSLFVTAALRGRPDDAAYSNQSQKV